MPQINVNNSNNSNNDGCEKPPVEECQEVEQQPVKEEDKACKCKEYKFIFNFH